MRSNSAQKWEKTKSWLTFSKELPQEKEDQLMFSSSYQQLLRDVDAKNKIKIKL